MHQFINTTINPLKHPPPDITIGVGQSALVDPKMARSLFAAESIKQSEQ